MYRRDRINERDVPESQHTIFIRGLPGSLTTEELRDFFGKDTGCTFDFVKVSPDRLKLYVAVRFESKTVARKIMEKCQAEGTILGYDVEMSWFRDIRRYLAHCAKQGFYCLVFLQYFVFKELGLLALIITVGIWDIIVAAVDRGFLHICFSTFFFRSYTRSPERGPTEEYSGGNKSVSRSASGSASRRSLTHSDADSRSRSKSASSLSSKHSEAKSLDYSDIVKKERSPSPPPKKQKSKKKERKDKKKRKRYSPTSSSPNIYASKTQKTEGSDVDVSDGDPSPPSKYANANQGQPQMTITMSKPIGPTRPDAQFTHRHVTVGSLATNQQQSQQKHSGSNAHHGVLTTQNASIPKFKAEQPGIVYQPMNGSKASKDEVSAKRPRVELESLQQPPVVRSVKSSAYSDMTASPVRESVSLANNFFKDIQRHILKDVKFKMSSNANVEESQGGFHLSSLSKQQISDNIREEKINKLSVELRECVAKKKREFEQSYRNDCETFGFVTQKLVEKDRTLEGYLLN
uniref:RRM domain-containing protein n=1 Tax=Meloidogyne hapla TaxID=6305 RepID=A0A1I8BBE1_MELHA